MGWGMTGKTGKTGKAGKAKDRKAWIPLPSQGMTVGGGVCGRRLFTALRCVHGYRETSVEIEERQERQKAEKA